MEKTYPSNIGGLLNYRNHLAQSLPVSLPNLLRQLLLLRMRKLTDILFFFAFIVIFSVHQIGLLGSLLGLLRLTVAVDVGRRFGNGRFARSSLGF